MKSIMSRVSHYAGRIALTVIITGMFVFGSMLVITGHDSNVSYAASSSYKKKYHHIKKQGGWKHGNGHHPKVPGT